MSLLRTWDSLGSREQLVILWFEKGQCASSPLPFGCLDVPPAPPHPWKPVGNRHSAPTVTEPRTNANATSLNLFVAWALGTHNLGPGRPED